MIHPGARTLYELAVECGDQRLLMAYCSNRGRRTILDVARKHGERLVALTGRRELEFAKRAGDGWCGGIFACLKDDLTYNRLPQDPPERFL